MVLHVNRKTPFTRPPHTLVYVESHQPPDPYVELPWRDPLFVVVSSYLQVEYKNGYPSQVAVGSKAEQ
jgi:hypothetical protein